MSQSPEDIENQRVSKLEELTKAENNLFTVQARHSRISRVILVLRLKQADMKAVIDQAKHIISVIRTEIKILETKFWQSRR